MSDEKKSLFDKAIDALTDRDEKEAEAAHAKSMAEAAKKEAEARAKMAADKAAADKAAAEKKAATEKAAQERADAVKAAMDKATARPKKGTVTVRSLRVRADHNTTSEVVAGLVKGNEVTILDTWTDGKDTWAKLENGWAAMVYDGDTYIKPA